MNQFDEKQHIENLIKSLNARKRQVRIEAADALLHLGEPIVAPLIDAIENNTFEYIYLPDAVRVLGRMGDQRAVDLLIDILTSNHVHAVQAATEALESISDSRAIPSLIHVFRLDWDDEETITTWQKASHALATFGPSALPALLNAMKDEDSNVRQGVIDALGQLQDPQAIPALVTMLEDKDQKVRGMVAEALGAIGDPIAIRSLVTNIEDKDKNVRIHICYALGDIDTVDALEPLIKALDDSEAPVRSAAIVNLGRMMGLYLPRRVSHFESKAQPISSKSLNIVQRERVIHLIGKKLKDTSSAVRSSSANILGQIGDERVLPDLLWIEQNDSDYAGANKVKDAATRAIQQIKERHQKS